MAKSDSSSPISSLANVMNCPVCYELYDGRIMMCHSGHAICEKCQKKLTECPQCRAKYTGTRNYPMEEVVAAFKLMNVKQAGKEKSKTTKTKTTTTPPNTKEANIEDLDFHGFVPTPEEQTSVPFNISNVLENILLKPKQIKGTHILCEMLKCGKELPICRLYNHIRYFHKDYYTEVKMDNDISTQYILKSFNIPVRSYRHALKIREFGLFFLKINVKKEHGNTTITGWIQGTVENRIARRIKYDLEISVGNVTAKYSDLSYGYNQSEIIIESKKECLEMIVTKPPRSMIVKLKVYRWTGVSRIGRTSETELVIVRPQSSQSTNNPNQNQNRPQTWQGKKKRFNRR